MIIRETDPSEFDAVAAVWEAAVKATHHFLSDADIDALRPLVRNEYLALVDLRVGAGGGDESGESEIRGFIGTADGKVEMLFVAPRWRGCGVGKQLLQYAVTRMNARLVDVNEQNPEAVGFYRRMGFEIAGRSPVDAQGKPFPLLHMRLANEREYA